MKFPHRRGIAAMLALLLLMTLSCSITFAQDTQVKYQRKSISYIDAVLKLGEGIQMTPENDAYLFKAIKTEMQMPRFDSNPLPETLLTKFKEEIQTRKVTDLDALAGLMNEILAPEILKIVDFEKEMRAKNLVSEAERNSFIVQKAKESGITAEDLKAIMNSAYVYMPAIFEVKELDYATTNSINYNLKGGILWFSIKTGETGSKVELLIKKDAVGKGAARRNAKSIKYKGESLSGKQYAFYTAAEALAANLKVATQEIPEFQLTNPITETGAGWVEFSMGKKEGLGVDDKFIVSEFLEQPDGSKVQKKLGMVRVAKVADNRDKRADSRARTVIGGGYERGQLAQEHPRLPIDLSFRFAVLPFKVTNGQGWAFDEIKTKFYAGQLWFQYNLARKMNISQLYGAIYGELGSGKLNDWQMFGNPAPAGLYWGVGGGLVKKFYVNRFHFGLEALAAFVDYRFWGSAEYQGSNHDWEWDISNFVLTLNGNLEIALSYDWNFGIGAAYRISGPTKDWTYNWDNVQQDLTGYNLPEAKFGGLGFQAYLTWSVPSLSYDPLKMMKGTLGY